jgi:hypothetical protein
MSNTALEMLIEMRQTVDQYADLEASETLKSLARSVWNWRAYEPDDPTEQAMGLCQRVLVLWAATPDEQRYDDAALEAICCIFTQRGLGADWSWAASVDGKPEREGTQ